MDHSTRKALLARCSPDPLSPGDDRYEDIDQGGAGPRGLSCTDEIVSLIELSAGPQVHFFSGLPGSGKSTELAILADRLKDPLGAHLWAVRIDAELLMDLDNDIDLPDLLLVLLFGAEDGVVALEQEGAAPPTDGVFTRMARWFQTVEAADPELDLTAGGEVGLPGAAKLSAGTKLAMKLKSQPTLRAQFRARAAAQFNAFVAEVNAELRALDQRARSQGFQGLALIVDSLEKLSGVSTNWTRVLDSAEVVYRRLDGVLALPVHTVMTVPPALVLRLMMPSLVFMPMIKLWDRRSRARDKAGFEVAYRMIERRIPEPMLRELLGAEHFQARRTQIIERSAGYPRELIRLLGKLITTPNASARFDQVLGQFANSVLDLVTTDEAVQVAAQVSVDTDIHVPDALRGYLDVLMSNNVILRYQDNEHWYDVHPVVREKPAVQRAAAAIRAQRAAGKTPP